MGNKTKIEVSKNIRDKLKVLVVAAGKKSYDDLLEDMMKTYLKAKKGRVIIELGEDN